MYCTNCGNETIDSANFCSSCGNNISGENTAEIPDSNLSNIVTKEESQKKIIQQQDLNEGWNWHAFLFGPLWYLYKGIIGKGLAIFIVAVILGSIIPALGAVPIWIYCGAKGNEDYQQHQGN